MLIDILKLADQNKQITLAKYTVLILEGIFIITAFGNLTHKLIRLKKYVKEMW